MNLTDKPIKSKTVLKQAINQSIHQVLVLGYDEQGEFYFASAPSKLSAIEDSLRKALDHVEELKAQTKQPSLPLG